jgi:hypothetical protein
MIEGVDRFVVQPSKYNRDIPPNLHLVCGDNLLEIIPDSPDELNVW